MKFHLEFLDANHGQQNGAESLYNLLISLSATQPKGRFIGIFDNDKVGKHKYDQLMSKKLHKNVKFLILPELDWAKKWKVKLQQYNTEAEVDLNGRALPIEMYFWKNFESDFSDTEKLFVFDQVPKLPDEIKTKLHTKIMTLSDSSNWTDCKKITDLLESIKF